MDYVESFVVPGAGTVCIDADNGVWCGGCRIHGAKSKDNARWMAHCYLVSQLRAAAHGHRAALEQAERSLNALDNDHFNLGKFIVQGTQA